MPMASRRPVSPCDHHDGRGGIDGADLVEQIEAPPPRQVLVHQDHGVRPAAQQGQRIVAVRGLGHREPMLLEEPSVGLETFDFVVDPEDRFGARHRRGEN
jgi:hypothetical protein